MHTLEQEIRDVESTSDSLAYLAFSTKTKTKSSDEPWEEVLRAAFDIVSTIMFDMTKQETAENFKEGIRRNFPNYRKAMMAVAMFASISLKKEVRARLTYEGFTDLEADFRQYGAQMFGVPIQEQAIFTAWSLRKISDLAQRINRNGNVGEENRATDEEFAARFQHNVLVSRFGLDCLTYAMYHKISLPIEILEEISEGLRAAVDAYAWIRQGVRLREVDPVERKDMSVAFDEEEQQLVAESMNDLWRAAS